MLLRLSANQPEFKPINFRPGFNAIVAARAAGSSRQNSRNARGKSTVLMFINYVLGGSRHKSLEPLAADGWDLTLRLIMFGGEVAATRSLAAGSKLKIAATGSAYDVIQPYLVEGEISLADWKDLLGLGLFRLEPSEQELSGALSVRTLLSYVVRTDTPKDPLKVIPQQSAASSRQHVAFMLGLDWEVVYELTNIKKSMGQLKTIAAAAKSGLVASLRTEEELALERASIMSEVDEWNRRISGFRILEDPNELVSRVNALTDQISRLRDQAVVNSRLRDLYVQALADDPSVETSTGAEIQGLFAGAGLVLADGFVRQVDAVEAFHAALLANRRTFMRSELLELEERLREDEHDLDQLDHQREEAMRTLDAGGVLEELNALRAELADAQGRMAAVDQQIEQARDLDAKREELKLARSTQRAEAARELANSRAKLDAVGDRFGAKMRELYGKDAALTVSVDDAGFKFAITVTGSGSTGVDRMTMLCFDLTMLEEGVNTGHHPDFLIHDSSVFDGVDPRQRAGAFQFAQAMVQNTGGQYICTINSNDVPDEVLEADWFKAGVVRTVLDTELGGLVGRDF
jgi:uncharacterized protein YydD (DUF2326 family)